MARQLGMHIQRGKLDAVETMFVAADIAEGLCVKQSAADTVEVVDTQGDLVYGVTGGKRSGVGVAVVRSGKIWMVLDAAGTPSLTAPAYCTAAGKVTHDSGTGANTLIGYFTSAEVATNGIQNVPTYADNIRCAQVFIDL